jgi:hypothetical protein
MAFARESCHGGTGSIWPQVKVALEQAMVTPALAQAEVALALA